MIDFGPLLSNPRLILLVLQLNLEFCHNNSRLFVGLPLKDAAAIGIIRARMDPLLFWYLKV